MNSAKTTEVVLLQIVLDPELLRARTEATRYLSSWALVTKKLDSVAPAIAVHLDGRDDATEDVLVQLCQAYVKVVGRPDQVPFDTWTVLLTLAEPVTTGALDMEGVARAMTGAFGEVCTLGAAVAGKPR